MRIVLAAAVILLTTAPTSASQRANDVPIAIPDGEPVSCIHTRNIRETHVRDSKTIDFVMAGGKVYRNDLNGYACPQLGFEKRFSHRTTNGQLCSVDTVSVITDPGLTRGPTCGLGKFQPVKLQSKVKQPR